MDVTWPQRPQTAHYAGRNLAGRSEARGRVRMDARATFACAGEAPGVRNPCYYSMCFTTFAHNGRIWTQDNNVSVCRRGRWGPGGPKTGVRRVEYGRSGLKTGVRRVKYGRNGLETAVRRPSMAELALKQPPGYILGSTGWGYGLLGTS